MAYLTQPDYVKYVCSCGQLKPITNLYFCRHCLKIRCGFCICHEVDSHYCANCLENMPSSEARLKKNRCSSCFDCPSCFHTLSTRATLAQTRQQPQEAGGGDAKLENKQPKKMYYLSCFNCRWTSRDVGIPDQPVASGGWPERPNPFAPRFNQLLEYYKALSLQEKQDKMKKFTIRGKYMTLTDKTGLTGAMARNLAGMPSSDSGPTSILSMFTPSAAYENLDDIEGSEYQNLDPKQITTMAQRLACPELQPISVTRLYPIAKQLSVKRSQRCKECDHNLTKPEYNPGSVKFKIELLGYYHVPEIKIISIEKIKPGKKSFVVLKLTNPTGHEMQINFLQPEDVPKEEIEETEVETEKKKDDSLTDVGKQAEKYYSPPCVALKPATVRMTCPSETLALSQRDDAAEYDDNTNTQPKSDIILWRKSNKLAIRLEVVPEESASVGTEAIVAFSMQYSYRNTVPPSGNTAQPKDHRLYTTVYVDLGLIEE